MTADQKGPTSSWQDKAIAHAVVVGTSKALLWRAGAAVGLVWAACASVLMVVLTARVAF